MDTIYQYGCLFKGETLDFVLSASKNQGIFDMTVSSEGHCKESNLTHVVNIRYNSTLNNLITEINSRKKLVSMQLSLYIMRVQRYNLKMYHDNIYDKNCKKYTKD